MKKAFLFIAVMLMAGNGIGWGQEIKTEEAKEAAKYREVSLEPGYRFYFSDKNPYLVNEYSLSRSAAYFMGKFNDLSPRNKLIADLEINEKDDISGDIHWYYKDKLSLELSKYTFIHNLEHRQLLQPPPTVVFTSPYYLDLNPSDKYDMEIRKQFLGLKYKPFSHPFHIKLYLEKLEKDGLIQKIFYGGRSLDPVTIALPSAQKNIIYSRTRNVQFETERVLGSVDGVLGGINFFLRADGVNFNDKMNNTPDGLIKYPTLTRNSQMLKLYSNSAGKFTWALHFNSINSQNNNRDETGQKTAEVTYTNSTALLSYNPSKNLKLALRLTYEDRDADNINILRFNPGTGSLNYTVKDAVSYVRKTASFTSKYYFSPNWGVKLNLTRKETERGLNGFNLPEYSHTTTAIAGIDGKVGKSLKVKLSQKVEDNHNPAYNATPDKIYNTKFNLTYDINDRMGIDFSGAYTHEKNGDNTVRHIRHNNVYDYNLAYWYTPTQKLSFNLYTNVEMQRYRSDLVFGTALPAYIRNYNVPYRSDTFHAGLNASLELTKKNTCYTDLFYIRGYGAYHPDFAPGSIGTYSYSTDWLSYYADTNFYQYGLLLGDRLKITKNGTLKAELGYKSHEEKTTAPLSGTVKTVFIAWEQRW